MELFVVTSFLTAVSFLSSFDIGMVVFLTPVKGSGKSLGESLGFGAGVGALSSAAFLVLLEISTGAFWATG